MTGSICGMKHTTSLNGEWHSQHLRFSWWSSRYGRICGRPLPLNATILVGLKNLALLRICTRWWQHIAVRGRLQASVSCQCGQILALAETSRFEIASRCLRLQNTWCMFQIYQIPPVKEKTINFMTLFLLFTVTASLTSLFCANLPESRCPLDTGVLPRLPMLCQCIAEMFWWNDGKIVLFFVILRGMSTFCAPFFQFNFARFYRLAP